MRILIHKPTMSSLQPRKRTGLMHIYADLKLADAHVVVAQVDAEGTVVSDLWEMRKYHTDHPGLAARLGALSANVQQALSHTSPVVDEVLAGGWTPGRRQRYDDELASKLRGWGMQDPQPTDTAEQAFDRQAPDTSIANVVGEASWRQMVSSGWQRVEVT